jgi:hypothetical protein
MRLPRRGERFFTVRKRFPTLKKPSPAETDRSPAETDHSLAETDHSPVVRAVPPDAKKGCLLAKSRSLM